MDIDTTMAWCAEMTITFGFDYRACRCGMRSGRGRRRFRVRLIKPAGEDQQDRGEDIANRMVVSHTAKVLPAEIDRDMSRFPSAKRLTSWAKLCLDDYVSQDTRKGGKTREGSRRLPLISCTVHFQPWNRRVRLDRSGR
jgi:Transposase IS116/IS110/IS902 family